MDTKSNIPGLIKMMRRRREEAAARTAGLQRSAEASVFRNGLHELTKADAAPDIALRNLLEDFVVANGLCVEALEYVYNVVNPR